MTSRRRRGKNLPYPTEEGYRMSFQVTTVANFDFHLQHNLEITTVDNRVELCVQRRFSLMQALDGKNIPARTAFSGDIIQRKPLMF